MKPNQYGAIAVGSGDADHDDEGAPREGRGTRRLLAIAVIGTVGIMFALILKHVSAKNQQFKTLHGKFQHVNNPNEPRFYDYQLVNHFTDHPGREDYWSNRYYQSTEYFQGPGHPIFLIVGGEGATDDGMFYPFVTDVLARRFDAAVLQVEHRFYGPYVPVENASTMELLELLTPHQAMSDMVRLVEHVREKEFGCSSERNSEHYCPVITVGGSYPGFLSAMFRLVYPDFAEISYAASAPLLMYAQAVDQYVYYDIVTSAAERASPGCANAVKTTLVETVELVKSANGLLDAATALGICPDSVPKYLKNQDMLQESIIQMTSFKFADDNMGNYPPGPETGLYKTCQVFQQGSKSSLDKMKDFLLSLDVSADDTTGCFDMMTQLRSGCRRSSIESE